jgi:hypothetical protein
VGIKVPMAHEGNDWSARGLSGHESVGSPKGMIYPSSAGTLTCVKTIETYVERAFATVCVQSAIAGCFFYFGEDS